MSVQDIYQEFGFSDKTLKQADQETSFIEIFQGMHENGESMFAYVAVKPSKMLEYKLKVAEMADIELEDFGEILYQGAGMYPNESTQKIVEELYGINHAHIREFNHDLEKQIESFKEAQ